MERYGIENIRVVGSHELWRDGKSRIFPDFYLIEKNAKSINVKNDLMVLDIEHWSVHEDNTTTRESISKYLSVLELYRSYRPELIIGYYGMPPVWNKYRAVLDDSHPLKQAWIKRNNSVRELADAVDIIYPSLYSTDDDPQSWRLFAVEYIKQARRLANGKQVIPFIWPQFHEGHPTRPGQYIPPDYWKLILDTVYEHADGVVIWGGWGDGGPQKWDEQAPWWRITSAFIKNTR